MKPPMQPICKGTDEKGELVWGFVPMARWQQAMFPVHYVGDFFAFWIRHTFFTKTGHEGDPKDPSMDIRRGNYKSKHPRRHHSGD